ncbi:GPW/gp25 family protein [Sphingomonas sp.]|uniref:GPW/gp25 family protein n=1 Tax=Sphingomonas sp. TaxID=28214 RepID=UPI0025FB1C53|nr:GPW/gp25 family protein [Sphingomonas sp.]
MTSPFGKSLAFPPRVGANGRMLWSEGEDNIRESIAIILKTMQRERVQLPGFGANLGGYLFEPNNAGTHARIARDIEVALGQWEPRIALDDVAVAPDAGNAVVTISYRLVASGAAESIAVAVPLGAQ